MSTFGIIMLCVSLILICVFIVLAFCVNEGFVIGTIIGVFLLVVPISEISKNPTNKDVENGKAHYVETQHMSISNNDTVRYSTYEIKKEEGFANNTQELDKIALFNSRQQKLFDL